MRESNLLDSRSFTPVRLIMLLAVLAVGGGCITVGPDYVPPEIGPGETWDTSLAGGLNAEVPDTQALARWWTVFDDQMLTSLIERALAANLDLREAGARIKEARARRSIARAGLFPSLASSASATRSGSKSSEDGWSESDSFSAAFDVSWELDLFGSVRRSGEAADAEFQASEESFRSVLVSMIAEVALNYIELRTWQARLATTENNLKLQQQTCDLVNVRYQAGLDDDLAVQQALSNLQNTRSQLPDLRTSVHSSLNSLAVLLGQRPGSLDQELTLPRAVPMIPAEVSIDVPAGLLSRRPDIRKAERDLAAQTARVGVATAELYPHILINGSYDLRSSSAGKLFSVNNSSYSFGPRLSWPIFKAGSILKNIEAQSALEEQALLQYEATVLKALEEVENIITAYSEEQNRWDLLNEAVQAVKNTAVLARYKYESGLIDFSSVLEAERSLNSFQDQLVQSEGTIASNLVRLYKALGGGWTEAQNISSNQVK